MGKKYYTPKIEEFYIGFECETLIQTWEGGDSEPVSEIEKVTIGGSYPFDRLVEGDFIKSGGKLNLEHFRVKRLDREDIESLEGWVQARSGARMKGVVGWDEVVNADAQEIKLFDDGTVIIKKHYAGSPIVAFHGKLKNKSELINQLKRCGIE